MTLRAASLATLILAATACLAMAAEPEQEPGEEAPYDLGYAFKASEACPNTELLTKPGEATQANADFKKGVAMFEHYVKVQNLDGACRAALTLYNSKTGKVAKLLRVK